MTNPCRVVFLREFRVLGALPSYKNLSGHKEKQYLETFGEPFVPEFVYGALREIQRFSSMRVNLLCFQMIYEHC